MPPDAARVLISSKQWRAAKLAPKKYGDKTYDRKHDDGYGPAYAETRHINAYLTISWTLLKAR